MGHHQIPTAGRESNSASRQHDRSSEDPRVNSLPAVSAKSSPLSSVGSTVCVSCLVFSLMTSSCSDALAALTNPTSAIRPNALEISSVLLPTQTIGASDASTTITEKPVDHTATVSPSSPLDLPRGAFLQMASLEAPAVASDAPHGTCRTCGSCPVAHTNPQLGLGFGLARPNQLAAISSDVSSPAAALALPSSSAPLATAALEESPPAPPPPQTCSAPGAGSLDGPLAGQYPPASDITDESVVLEAWDVVNETFFDARNKGWSAEAWAAKRDAMLRRPPRSRPEAYAMISSMLASLSDPYSRFVTPQQFALLAKYDVTGIGLNIGDDVEGGAVKIKVVGLVLGSPAQIAGVRQGDELLSVDGTPVTGLSPFDVSSLIQGPKGTPVTVAIRHGACETVQTLTMLRASEVATPVLYRLDKQQPLSPLGLFQDFGRSPSPSSSSSSSKSESPEATGYIRLREFNAAAKRDMVTAVQRLEAAGATSLVLDLQDNPGGLVQAGVEIAKLFLEHGQTVVYTEGRAVAGSMSSQRGMDVTGQPLTRLPLTVLVNGRTASASEILAAALRDNCRGILVGTRTFGKGLIQSVYELNDGSGMVLTVGKYVTPSHVDIDGNGIAADFRRRPSADLLRWKLATCQVPR